MNKFNRRRFGGLLVFLSLIAVAALAFTDVSLVSISSRHFDDTGSTISSLRIHWSLVITAFTFIAGVGLILIPRHDNAA